MAVAIYQFCAIFAAAMAIILGLLILRRRRAERSQNARAEVERRVTRSYLRRISDLSAPNDTSKFDRAARLDAVCHLSQLVRGSERDRLLSLIDAESQDDQRKVHAYDHIEIPPIKPVTTRVHLHSGVCPGCEATFTAPVPEGMEPGSPFGPGIQALLIHLHVTQAMSFERLKEIMKTVFGLDISEGAVANILQRALKPILEAAEEIGEEVRRAEVIASEETSARICGRKHWQWVMHTTTAIYHIIADTHAARIITNFLGGARPKVWVADRYGAQNGHGERRQVCLAHLLRDAQYAIDSGDTVFAPGFKSLLKRACNIGKRRDRLKDTTLAQYLARLQRQLTHLMMLAVPHKQGQKPMRAIKRCRTDLFVFMTRRDVPYTNNGSERALRMSVIFRKVTGCFRSAWGSQFYAATISVIATAKLHGKTAFQAIADVISQRNPPTLAA